MSCAQLVHHQPVVSKQLGAAQDCFVGLRLDGPVIHGLSCGLGVVGLHHHKLQRRSPLGYGKFSNGRRRGSLAKVAQQRFVASERECEVVIKDEDDDELHAVLKDRIRNELQGVNVDDVENERREGNIEKVGISELSSSMQGLVYRINFGYQNRKNPLRSTLMWPCCWQTRIKMRLRGERQ